MQGRNHVKALFGTGFHFPIEVDEVTGRMKTVSYEEDIAQAIQIILLTRKGERVRSPMFGCGIYSYAFGTMDYTTLKQMEKQVVEALDMWEPRIEKVEVRARVDEEHAGTVLIDVRYVVKATHTSNNLIFPFSMNEGFEK